MYRKQWCTCTSQQRMHTLMKYVYVSAYMMTEYPHTHTCTPLWNMYNILSQALNMWACKSDFMSTCDKGTSNAQSRILRCPIVTWDFVWFGNNCTSNSKVIFACCECNYSWIILKIMWLRTYTLSCDRLAIHFDNFSCYCKPYFVNYMYIHVQGCISNCLIYAYSSQCM